HTLSKRDWSSDVCSSDLGARHAFGADFAAALSAPPALAIGCGRQAALATRLVRDTGARAVQILDPRLDPSHWDLVIAPEHDGLRSEERRVGKECERREPH